MYFLGIFYFHLQFFWSLSFSATSYKGENASTDMDKKYLSQILKVAIEYIKLRKNTKLLNC